MLPLQASHKINPFNILENTGSQRTLICIVYLLIIFNCFFCYQPCSYDHKKWKKLFSSTNYQFEFEYIFLILFQTILVLCLNMIEDTKYIFCYPVFWKSSQWTSRIPLRYYIYFTLNTKPYNWKLYHLLWTCFCSEILKRLKINI